jgi:hypothetical protein
MSTTTREIIATAIATDKTFAGWLELCCEVVLERRVEIVETKVIARCEACGTLFYSVFCLKCSRRRYLGNGGRR